MKRMLLAIFSCLLVCGFVHADQHYCGDKQKHRVELSELEFDQDAIILLNPESEGVFRTNNLRCDDQGYYPNFSKIPNQGYSFMTLKINQLRDFRSKFTNS